jgi:hypothetical protein
MSKYEEENILHNTKIKAQIKRLQSEIKPVENPIVAKILPFLPYDVNKIILDKLDIQKEIYLLEKKFYGLFSSFINNRLSFYTCDDELFRLKYLEDSDNDSDDDENTLWNSGMTLKYKILKKYEIRVFDYPNNYAYNRLQRLRNKRFVRIYNSTDNYDLKKSIEIMIYKHDKICDILGDEMFERLRPLSMINPDRTNKTIHFEYDYNTEYKIFKSNGAINKKQFDRLIENVKLEVLHYKKKIETILYIENKYIKIH